MIPTNKLAVLCTTFCAVMLAFSHNASAVTALAIGDTHELGFVQFGIPSGDSDRLAYVNHLIGMRAFLWPASPRHGDRLAYVNHLIGMALGTTDHTLGRTFGRSNNPFGSLPTVLAGHLSGTSTTIDLGTGLYSYLFAKYDGPKYGSEVWYVGNLSGIITIPAKAGKYGLSSWTLFGPGGAVPDGGATVMLLGAALGALGIARRFLMS